MAAHTRHMEESEPDTVATGEEASRAEAANDRWKMILGDLKTEVRGWKQELGQMAQGLRKLEHQSSQLMMVVECCE